MISFLFLFVKQLYNKFHKKPIKNSNQNKFSLNPLKFFAKPTIFLIKSQIFFFFLPLFPIFSLFSNGFDLGTSNLVHFILKQHFLFFILFLFINLKLFYYLQQSIKKRNIFLGLGLAYGRNCQLGMKLRLGGLTW